MPAEDSVAAALEEIRGDVREAAVDLYALLPGAVATPGQVFAAGILAGTAGKLRAAVEAALALHAMSGPERRWPLSLRCPAHDWSKGAVASKGPVRWQDARDCPDCGHRDHYSCAHCGVSTGWPCPTVQAITRALLGEEAPGGPRHPRLRAAGLGLR